MRARRADDGGAARDLENAQNVRQRLETTCAFRAFAGAELSLPDDNSYRMMLSYRIALMYSGDPMVVKNVFAALELELEPALLVFPDDGLFKLSRPF